MDEEVNRTIESAVIQNESSQEILAQIQEISALTIEMEKLAHDI